MTMLADAIANGMRDAVKNFPSWEEIEEALLIVRRQSYEDGYNTGRNVLIVKDISTPLTHADKRSVHDDEIHNNPTGNHARKLSTHARAQHGRAGFFAHRHARDASRAAAHHHKEMARFAHGVGDKDRAHRHEGAAQSHEANAEYHEKRRHDLKTERKKKGLLSRILRKGVDPSSQEELALLVKAINTAKRRKEWISDKVEELVKEGKTPERAGRLARKMLSKKEERIARRKHPGEFCPKCSARQERDGDTCNRCGHCYEKAMDKEVVWVALSGVVVAADAIQFKETDGAADGLNEERRNEEHNKEFDPLKVPPIAVWHNNTDHQIYVVDGHKRVAEAKKRGLPTLRAFFIDAKSFEDAKKKGEKLNVKAFDESKHKRAAKGTSTGGQFTKGAGADYSHTAKIREARELHAEQLQAPGHESGADKGSDRPKATEKGAYVNRNAYLILKQKAMTKILHVANHPAHKPTKEEIKENKANIAKKGANTARKDLNGNNIQRRERKVALAKEFGDGKTCGCVYCGMNISYSPQYSKKSMEEDKIHDTEAGGRYRMGNLLPACVSCNRSRGNKDAVEFLQNSTYAQEGVK